MAVTYAIGFESKDGAIEGVQYFASTVQLNGTAAYSTVQARTGVVSLRCNPASGAQGYVSNTPNVTGVWVHFGLYVAALPTADRLIFGVVAAGAVTLRLTSAGTITVYDNTTLVGTSTQVLATGQWYWIGVRYNTGTSVSFLQIDGVDAGVTGTVTVSQGWGQIGCAGFEATAIDIYIDDIISDDAGFLLPSRVALLIPTADSAKGTGWTNDAAATTNLFDAVNNEPPAGIADTTVGSGLHQIRNATSNANVNYDATMTTYAAAGLTPQDKVLAVVPIIATGAPVTTSSKQGTVGVASNPTITNVALGSGGTAGAFWSGTAAGTYPTGWKASAGTLTLSPTVTVATAPVMRVTQVTSSTRIAMVSFMGIYVAWTPGALGVIDEPGVFPGRGPRNVNQGINRASSY